MEELFKLLPSRYQIGLETSMRGSDFVYDYVNLMCYKCHKRNLKFCRPYIDHIHI